MVMMLTYNQPLFSKILFDNICVVICRYLSTVLHGLNGSFFFSFEFHSNNFVILHKLNNLFHRIHTFS